MSVHKNSRLHLSIADKNRVRRYYRQHPELTQDQLREWVHGVFGKGVARSTIGHIVRTPEEENANPDAIRLKRGRYPDMEQELYSLLVFQAAQMGIDLKCSDRIVLSDTELWTKANEILKRTRGSGESVSVAWVHRFKRRHGLHRSQQKRKINEDQVEAGRREVLESETKQSLPVKSDDILLLTHILAVRPWSVSPTIAGWELVMERLRREDSFKDEKTVQACQARLNLLLSRYRAGNSMPADNDEELKRLITEVATELDKYERRDDTERSPLCQEQLTLRRLELIEKRMEQELTMQRQRAEEQVARLEKLRLEQQKRQQEQHAELVATIQQQQTIMMELVKSLTNAS